MKLYKRTWAEISLDRLAENYRVYRAKVPEGTEIMCVVKAFCYGHSDRVIAPFLQSEFGIRYFAVSNVHEAIRLRKAGIEGDILILGYTSPDEVPELEEFNIIQTVMSIDYAQELEKRIEGRLRCHIAIDTGMTRIGLRGSAGEIADVIERIAAIDKLSVEGAFTHFAVADTLNNECIAYTKRQKELFFAAVDEARARGIALETAHCLNSAGGLFHYDERSALARLGIVLYGLKPDVALEMPEGIKPVMALRSTVSQVKEIEAGTTVSYGRTYTADRTVKLATVACGYADGYPRALSNRGEILVHGKRCPIVGRICMDQFMCDVTGVEVKAGDIVTLIGDEGEECITADDIAELCGTIGYEIVCGISERVPRAAVKDGKIEGIYKL